MVNKIGLDLDNTLIDFSVAAQFYALKVGLENIRSMSELKEVLKAQNDFDWQKAQSWIYTEGLNYAKPAKGWDELIENCDKFNIELYIVSHKSKFSPKEFGHLNLHFHANRWLKEVLNSSTIPSVKGIFFEPSREKKIEKIRELGLTKFVDDLPEVFDHENFPKNVQKIQFVNELDSSRRSFNLEIRNLSELLWL